MGLFKRNVTIVPQVILTSELHDEHSFYERLLEDIEYAEKSLYIESPFVGSVRGLSLLPYLETARAKGVQITVFTRNPVVYDVASAIQANAVLHEYRRIRIRVRYSSRHHHRKLAIIDDKIMYEGSLNILSHVRSEELMRRFDSAELVAQTQKYLRI